MAFPQSQISESGTVSQVFRYNGKDYLPSHLSRNDIDAKNDEGVSVNLEDALYNHQNIPFMPIDIEETNEYINRNPYYVLRLYGPLINGQKAVVTITGIKVFFDICVPDNEDINSFETKVKNILTNEKDNEERSVEVGKIRIEHVKAFPIRGYHPEKKSYLRIFTTTTFQRKTALEIIRKENLETASDDISAYYRKVAREYRIPLSGWDRLPYNGHSPLCSHAFYVSIENFHAVNDLSELCKIYHSPVIIRDRALVLAWDIETHSTRGLEHVPYTRYKEDNAFMICMTVHWKDDLKPLKQICLVDVESARDPNWITIVCGNETNLLKAFALCWRALAPDIELTYNGSKYDWPFVIERATQLKVLDWMFAQMSENPRRNITIDGILRWNYYGGVGEPFYKDFFHKEQTWAKFSRKEDKDSKKIKNQEGVEIKITPEENFKSTFLKVPGCVSIDVLVCCKKLYPKSEKNSLNYFLEMHGLGSKIDLPIKNMRKFYMQSKKNTTSETAENIRKIAEYCIKDALSCQKLWLSET
ncbi:ribonuclease H-like domain-containing protein [Gigaspora rosea]|uniref:DNA polymerase delta catalytic subunit n=1 Tax=Gigaspora rosea TaxID=44941 RepID=A0A397TTP9_9GLOM|nr:ribonuclease H-like domain-containing protein [Gigaspora rosea]